MKENLKNSLSKIIIFSFILFFIFLQPSFSVIITDVNSTNTSRALNYTLIEILPPENIYDEITRSPDNWNNILSDTKQMSAKLGMPVDGNTATTSVDDIAKSFNAVVSLNDSEYAFSYIKVPNENYEGIVNAYENIGFEVRNVTYLKPDLNESLNSINLPFTYETSPGQYSTLTGAGRRIAILDSGVDDTHTDFSGRLKFWADVSEERNASYTDHNGHGTHVASIAAGSGAESGGKYTGVAPGADLYIWKITDLQGGVTEAAVANAINQAVDKNVDVISLSYGELSSADICNNLVTGDYRAVFNAIQSALGHNIVFVASVGNEGPTGIVHYPACIAGAIAVGSTAKKDYPDNFYNPLDYSIDNIGSLNKIKTNVLAEVQGQFTKSKEAWATNLYSNSIYSGSHFTIQPSSWPATVNLKLESEHKDHPLMGSTDVWWDPGSRDQGDAFWNLDSQTFNSGKYVGIEYMDNALGETGPLISWWNIYTNKILCSDSSVSQGPRACDTFDSDKSGCQNQQGCSWCGCNEQSCIGPFCSWSCNTDRPQDQCTGDGREWKGCDGTPKKCDDSSRINWPYQCGTPATTGCVGTWVVSSITYEKVFSKNTPGTKDFVSFFSNRGPAPNGVNKPDITAPGEFICAAKSSEIDLNKDGTMGLDICDNAKYQAYSGTSMATPFVSGVVALMKEENPDATVGDIRNALFSTAEPAGYGRNIEGNGRVNGNKAIAAICDAKDVWTCNGDTKVFENYSPGLTTCNRVDVQKNCNDYDGGYTDDTTDPQKCNYLNQNSANQMRDYTCSNGGCICNVAYDSLLNSIKVNGASSGDVAINKTDYINVDVTVKNTGVNAQAQWYLGLESYNVSDFNDPGNTRDYINGRISAFYNGKDGTHGCILKPDNTPQGYCPSGVDCKILSESVNANGILDVGETIIVECKVPALFYPATTGNQRIMFWVHERDLGQDAGKDGNGGNTWWADALARSGRTGVQSEVIGGGPADIKVKISPDGGYQDSATDQPKCQNYNYGDYTSANQMRNYTGSNCNVTYDSYITNVCAGSNCENYDSPLLYYKFDSDSGLLIHDSSPNNYVGVTLAKHVDGYREKALNFTFLDYVNITSRNINLYNLSIEAWVKMPFYKPSTPYHYSLVAKEGDKWNASSNGDYDFDWFFTSPTSTNMSSLGFYYTYSGGKCALEKSINDTITNIMDNNWHHLAFTFDSTSSKGVFYLDGNKFYESVGCGPLVMYPNNTRMGQMIGNMDEVKIYNKVINYSSSTFSTSDNISVDVDIKNTGLNQQTQWFVGVEFWKVNDPTNPLNTRSQGVYTYYNGTNKSHGNQQGVSGADCSLINDPNGNGYLDPGETIRVRCWVPASYYGTTTGNQRIMFWVHERDLGQDAGNDLNGGNTWWTDALAVIAPSRVMAGIIQGPCPWDVTGDGKINVLDTIKIASKLNTKLGGPGWDPTVDVNKDGKIDVLDLIAVASRLGQTC